MHTRKDIMPQSLAGLLQLVGLLSLSLLCVFLTSPVMAANKSAADLAAKEILSIPTVRPQIAAVIGCHDAALPIALARGGVEFVHALTADTGEVQPARRIALQAGFAAQVTVDFTLGTNLPYADDILNVEIIDNYPALRQRGVSLDEMMRVLAPYNTLVFGGIEDKDALRHELAQAGLPPDALHQQGQWLWLVKPLPATMDEWPSRYHDAGHGRVSHDQLVAPATGFRWLQGPVWPSHNSRTLAQEVVAGNGRSYYVERDDAMSPIADLVARDAFNGTFLWSRPIGMLLTHLMGVDGLEDTELVSAYGDQVYTRLSLNGPVAALNAANGNVRWESKVCGTFRCSDGLLIVRTARNRWVSLNPVTGAELRHYAVLDSYIDADALAADGRLIVVEAGQAEIANAQHGDDPVWRKALFKQEIPARGSLVCFDLKSGAILWKKPNIGEGQPYWLEHGLLMTRNHGGSMSLFDMRDGAYRWSQTMGTKLYGWPAAFYMKDTIWGYGKTSWYQNYDPLTGAVLKVDGGRWKEFGRCGADVATDRWILGQEMQITDLADGQTYDQFFTRGDCGTSYIPAYGLLFNHGHGCACSDYIRGIQGVVCTPPPNPAAVVDPTCEHGPAFGQAPAGADATPDDWPTYRHDAFRGGGCLTPVAAAATARWSLALAAPLSAPVVMDNVVYLACIDQHRVVAVDGRTGNLIWNYLAGGRIDTPPTIYHGLALFGCRDGWLYALRASDGELVWRVRLAPLDRLISVRGQLESAWPLFGAVLVDHDVIWATAGIHGDADGGVWAATLDPTDGHVLWHENLHGFPPYRTQSSVRLIEARGKIPDDPTEAKMAAADQKLVSGGLGYAFANDVLISNGKTVFLGALGLDAVTHKAGPPVGQAIYTAGVSMPVDTMDYHPISYGHPLQWAYAGKAAGPAWMRNTASLRGNLIVLSANASYTVNYPNRINAPHWSVAIPGQGLVVKALVAAGDRLVVACRVTGAAASPSGEIRILSAADGLELGRMALPAPPRFDAMAVGSGDLLVSLEDGQLFCFRAKPDVVAPPVPMVAQKPVPPVLRPIAVALPVDDLRAKLLAGTKLSVDSAVDVLAAMADNKYAVVVADADPASLQRLADAPAALKAFTTRGGWLLLWGLEPAGLASFNKIVGVEHLLRPFELEKVTLAEAKTLLPGLREDEVTMECNDGMGYSGGHYQAVDAWYGALDYNDIAPFCTLPGSEYWGRQNVQPKSDRYPRNMVNGFTEEDWHLQFVFSLDEGAHTTIPLTLPRQETVVGFGIYPGPYGQIRRLRLTSDIPGVKPAEVELTSLFGREEFTIPPMRANKITVECIDWAPSIAAPLLSVANLWLHVQRSPDFIKKVHPLLTPGVLLSYPRDAGGIVLSQVRPLPAEKLTGKSDDIVHAGERKKSALMVRLLQSLAEVKTESADSK